MYTCPKLHHPIVNNYRENKTNNLAARASVNGKMHTKSSCLLKCTALHFQRDGESRLKAKQYKIATERWRRLRRQTCKTAFLGLPFLGFPFFLRSTWTKEWTVRLCVSYHVVSDAFCGKRTRSARLSSHCGTEHISPIHFIKTRRFLLLNHRLKP